MKKFNILVVIMICGLACASNIMAQNKVIVVPLNSSSSSASGTSSLMVSDKNDTELGRLLDYSTNSVTLYTSNGKIINMSNSGDVISTNIRYTTGDCTGQPYLIATTQQYIVKARGGNYFETTGTTLINTQASYWRTSDSTCIPYSNTSQWMLEVTQIDPATSIPFSLPVSAPYNIQ